MRALAAFRPCNSVGAIGDASFTAFKLPALYSQSFPFASHAVPCSRLWPPGVSGVEICRGEHLRCCLTAGFQHHLATKFSDGVGHDKTPHLMLTAREAAGTKDCKRFVSKLQEQQQQCQIMKCCECIGPCPAIFADSCSPDHEGPTENVALKYSVFFLAEASCSCAVGTSPFFPLWPLSYAIHFCTAFNMPCQSMPCLHHP